MSVEETPKQKIDACPECVKSGDRTPKEVFPCSSYCRRFFCSFHLRPSLTNMPNFKTSSKRQRRWDTLVKRERGKGDCHPCAVYTSKFLKKQEEVYEMPKMSYYPEPTPKNKIVIKLPEKQDVPKTPKLQKLQKSKSISNQWSKKVLKNIVTVLAVISLCVIFWIIFNLLTNPDFLHFYLNKISSTLNLAFGSGWVIIFWNGIPIPISFSVQCLLVIGAIVGSIIMLLLALGIGGWKGFVFAVLIILITGIVIVEPGRITTQDFDTRQQLFTFLQTDNTDQMQYTSDFKCIDFSQTLIDHAEKAGYRLYFTSNSDHAFCKAYITSEDMWLNIEPQTDEIQ